MEQQFVSRRKLLAGMAAGTAWMGVKPASTAAAQVISPRPATTTNAVQHAAGMTGALDASLHLTDATGQNDMTAAFRGMLAYAAANGVGHITIPPGTYLLNAGVIGHLPDAWSGPLLDSMAGLTLEGLGEVWLVTQVYGDILALRNCTNIAFVNLGFRGPGMDIAAAAGLNNVAQLNLLGANRGIRVERCRFRDFMHGVSQLNDQKASSAVWITQCSFSDGGDGHNESLQWDGAAVSGVGSGWHVTDNEFQNCLRCIELENVDYGPSNGGPPITGAIITGNRMVDVGQIGVMLFSNPVPGSIHQILIANNIIQGCAAYRLDRGGGDILQSGILLGGGDGIVVQNNFVHGIKGYAAISSTTSFAPISNLRITGNIVSQSGDPSKSVGRAIQVSEQSHPLMSAIISENLCTDAYDYYYGAILIAGGTQVTVAHNHIRQSSLGGNTKGGIHVFGISPAQPATGVRISGNLLQMHNPSGAAIYIGNNAREVILDDNVLNCTGAGGTGVQIEPGASPVLIHGQRMNGRAAFLDDASSAAVGAGHLLRLRREIGATGTSVLAAGLPTPIRLEAVLARAEDPVTLTLHDPLGGSIVVTSQVLNATGWEELPLAHRLYLEPDLWATKQGNGTVEIVLLFHTLKDIETVG